MRYHPLLFDKNAELSHLRTLLAHQYRTIKRTRGREELRSFWFEFALGLEFGYRLNDISKLEFM